MLEKLKRTLRGQKESSWFRVPGQIQDGSRILALVSTDLTALLFHAPLFAAIRRTWPGASIDVLAPEDLAPIVVPSGLARQVMVYGEKQLAGWKPAFRNLQRTLADAHYDVSIVVDHEPNSALENLARATGAALRLGPSHPDAWPAVNLELRTEGDDVYVGDRLDEIGPFLGIEHISHRLPWPLPADQSRQVAQLIHFNKPRPEEWLVGVDVGVDREGRAISHENLNFLLGQLKSQAPCRILPLSMPGHIDRRKQFEALLPSPVPPAFARDTMLETLLLLSQCDLFVAGNTDLLHAAVALRVPAIGLFGKHVERRWRPTGSRCRVLPVTKGEKVDIATLMDTIGAVMANPHPDDHGGAMTCEPSPGPLPAPGA